MIGAVTGESNVPTADHIQAVKEQRWDRNKYQDDPNDAKLREIINDEKHVFLGAKYTASWMSVRSTTVTGTVLSTTDYCDFYVPVMTLTPLSFKENVTIASRNFLCVTRLFAATEVSSYHITTRYVTKSSTSPENPSPLTVYA